MGMNLFDRIQAKIELFRLEQRYTRRRHRRSTFVSNAIYVDGEYIYQSPNTTGSSTSTSKSASTQYTTTPVHSVEEPTSKQQKKLNRWSSMPGFGSSAKPEVMGGLPSVREHEDRRKRVSFHDERGY
ncbi:uncharacterized protein B0T15DRAFT_262033 [Chaetomium strumarium]|uniref:Uncharacterized protein n=1 Tax=Chaetomium strumarium TaxID=1170767 RepID=A0AAJ0GN53_9PEZI|nr:hypothetical protein B0T15DRAFT_262033 [Chaetomium strumarium]